MTIEDLKAFGANTEEGLTRCFGNEGLYLKLVGTVPGDANFDKLQHAAADGDSGAVFEAAHALKGALGNLSLTPMYDIVSDICDAARDGAVASSEQIDALLGQRSQLETIVNS